MLQKQDFLDVALFCTEGIDSNSSSEYLGKKKAEA